MEKKQPDNPESRRTDPRLKSFLRQAAAIIAAEKGLNADSRVKLQALADRVKLTPELFDEALARLQKSSASISNLTHYEKAFVQFLDSEFEKLTGGVISPGMENNAIDLAKRKYQINGTRAEQLIDVQAEAAGISRISPREAESFAENSIEDRVGESKSVDDESREQLYKIGKMWGLDQAAVDRIVNRQIKQNKARKYSAWKKLIAATSIGALLLAIGLGTAYAAGWIPKTWMRLPGQAVVSPPEPDKSTETPPTFVSRFSSLTREKIESLRTTDSQLKQAADNILGETETQRQLGYQQLVTRVCVDGQRPVADLICELFYDDPDEGSALGIIHSLQQFLDLSQTDSLSVRDLKTAYQANRLLGQLYFARPGLGADSVSRRHTVEECIRFMINIPIGEDLKFETYLTLSETAIALDQWNQLNQLAWASPGRASVLLQPLDELTRSRLDLETSTQCRDDALASIMETDSSRWREVERPIRASVAGCDEAKLIDWISIFEGSQDSGLRDLLGELLLPRINVQPKSRRREDISEAIEKFGLEYRNQVFRPVIDRNELLQKLFANTMELETGDTTSTVSPDRIAQLALAVNVEMAFCAAIENATHIDDSSFVEFDRLVAMPAPRLRELISLPIDRRDSSPAAQAAATASDKRRMTTSMERLSDLSLDASGLRILALNQLERVAHRFERISYLEAEVLARHLLSDLPIKEQLHAEKLLGSFSHWPNLALAIADRLPDSNATLDQALTLARLLLGRGFEMRQAEDWQRTLQSRILAAVSNDIENQIDQDPNNVKSNWNRLKIYLNESYRERLAIGLKRSYLSETFLEPYQAATRLVEAMAVRQARINRNWNVERAIQWVRQSSSNEIEKTAFANQLLIQVLSDELAGAQDVGANQLLVSEIQNLLRHQSLAGDQLYATELALLRVVDRKRMALVDDLLKRAGQKR